MQEFAATLIEQIVTKLEAPRDQVRLDAIDLDNDTESEEQYTLMRSALCHILTIIAHKQIILLKSSLVRCVQLIDAQPEGQMDTTTVNSDEKFTVTQLYQVFLAQLEIYQRKKFAQMRP